MSRGVPITVPTRVSTLSRPTPGSDAPDSDAPDSDAPDSDAPDRDAPARERSTRSPTAPPGPADGGLPRPQSGTLPPPGAAGRTWSAAHSRCRGPTRGEAAR